MTSRLGRILHEKQGMTMVNVIVGFVVFLLLIAMFTGVVKSAQMLMQRADQLRKDTGAAIESYYKSENGTVSTEQQYLSLTRGSDAITLDCTFNSYQKYGNSQKVYYFKSNDAETEVTEETQDEETPS